MFIYTLIVCKARMHAKYVNTGGSGGMVIGNFEKL